jgi:hypothetical protein
MEGKRINFPSAIAIMIGVLGILVGVIFDIDAHSIKDLIAELTFSVHALNDSLSAQEKRIEKNSSDIEVLKALEGRKIVFLKGDTLWPTIR